MKKIIIVIMVLSLPIILCGCQKKEAQDMGNIEIKEQSFSISDNGTEIEVLLKNDNDITLEKIEAILYDSENKQIGIIDYNKQIILKSNKSTTIKLISKEKYSSTSEVKYKIY